MAQTAKKQQPTGEYLNINEIAERCGIHRQTCGPRLDDLGYTPDAERSNAKLKVYWFDEEMRLGVKSANSTLDAMRIRDLRVKAQLNEMKLAEARGDLVPINDVMARVQEIMSRMYKEFAMHQPKRLAARLARAKTAAEVQKLMKLDTAKVMSKLREADEAFVPETR